MPLLQTAGEADDERRLRSSRDTGRHLGGIHAVRDDVDLCLVDAIGYQKCRQLVRHSEDAIGPGEHAALDRRGLLGVRERAKRARFPTQRCVHLENVGNSKPTCSAHATVTEQREPFVDGVDVVRPRDVSDLDRLVTNSRSQ